MGNLKGAAETIRDIKSQLIQPALPAPQRWEGAEAVRKCQGLGHSSRDRQGKGLLRLELSMLSRPQEPRLGKPAVSSSLQRLDFLSNRPSGKNCHMQVVNYTGSWKKE